MNALNLTNATTSIYSDDPHSPNFNWYPDASASCPALKAIGTWLFFVTFGGIILNGLVVYVYIKNKDLRSTSNNLIMQIVVGDLVACFLEMPMPMIAMFACK
jgi:hypothetical protein